MMRSRKPHIALVVLLICWVQMTGAAKAVAGQKFRADEWVTECDASRGAGGLDRSITVPFWESHGAPQGSFTLVVMLQTGNIGIVGQPFSIRAVLRVDKNPPIECGQPRYCAFPSAQAPSVLKQLKIKSLVLIDVYTENGGSSASA